MQEEEKNGGQGAFAGKAAAGPARKKRALQADEKLKSGVPELQKNGNFQLQQHNKKVLFICRKKE